MISDQRRHELDAKTIILGLGYLTALLILAGLLATSMV